jgi:hypothetical protein
MSLAARKIFVKGDRDVLRLLSLAEPDPFSQELYKALKNSDNIEVTRLGDSGVVAYDVKHHLADSGRPSFCPSVILVRSFFGTLLSKLMSCPSGTALVIGNAGTGKSFTHYAIIAALINPEKFAFSLDNPLLKDMEVVVREVAPLLVDIWFINTGEVLRTRGAAAGTIVEMFDRTKMLYLYEPGNVLMQPDAMVMSYCQYKILTLSPNEARFKEVEKNGDRFDYPCWSKAEILDVGHFMHRYYQLNIEKVPHGADVALLDPVLVGRRFEEFNGIFRSVFPRSTNYLRLIRKKRI